MNSKLNFNIIKIINEYVMIAKETVINNKNKCLQQLLKNTIILKYHLTFSWKNEIIHMTSRKNWYMASLDENGMIMTNEYETDW
jgi:ABC-type enterochelin transport system substrate-binding protein